MLDFQTALKIKEAIKQEKKIEINLTDVCRMQIIGTYTNYTVLGVQSGHRTILVLVEFSEKFGFIINRIKILEW